LLKNYHPRYQSIGDEHVVTFLPQRGGNTHAVRLVFDRNHWPRFEHSGTPASREAAQAGVTAHHVVDGKVIMPRHSGYATSGLSLEVTKAVIHDMQWVPALEERLVKMLPQIRPLLSRSRTSERDVRFRLELTPQGPRAVDRLRRLAIPL
jgi:hypothetical protein